MNLYSTNLHNWTTLPMSQGDIFQVLTPEYCSRFSNGSVTRRVPVSGNTTAGGNNNSCSTHNKNNTHNAEMFNIMLFIAILNFLLNIWAMRTFYLICRYSRQSQIIHQLLLFLTFVESFNMLCFITKSLLFRCDLLFNMFLKPQSLSQLRMKYCLTMMLQSFSTVANWGKNIWLAVIAMTRGVAMLILLWRPESAASRRRSVAESHHCWITSTFFGLMGLLSLVRLTIYVVVEARVTILLCPLSSYTVLQSTTPHKIMTVNMPQKYLLLVDWLHESLLFVLPFVLMTVCNALIWVAMSRMMASTSLITSHSSGGTHPRLKRLRRVSRTVMLLITVYLVLEIPFMVLHIIHSYVPKKYQTCNMIRFVSGAMQVADFLVTLDTTCNVVIYYMWEHVFQEHIREQFHSAKEVLFTYWQRLRPKDDIAHTNSTSLETKHEPLLNHPLQLQSPPPNSLKNCNTTPLVLTPALGPSSPTANDDPYTERIHSQQNKKDSEMLNLIKVTNV